MVENTILFHEKNSSREWTMVNSSSTLNVSLHTIMTNIVSSNLYGTTIAAVKAVSKTGRKCILDIEMEVHIAILNLM
jgi:hypothetical protein